MDEYKTSKTEYTPNDLVLFLAKGLLEISPKFQRRAVWGTPARSYFIDTLLRGMTVPPMYFRTIQNKAGTNVIREVVDGQQRVRSVLEFIDPEKGYRLSKTLGDKVPWAGKRFAQLTKEQQQQITSFGFSVEIFKGISDKQVLEVFCRLNMNGIPLNKQELRNGKYFGLFKQTSFALALDYIDFWRDQRIFSNQSIARMLEVELVSELLIAGSEGMQDKKTNIDTYYQQWEEEYPRQKKDEKRFLETMGTIVETFSDEDLANSEFRRPPLFYTLYCVVYHHLYGLPGVQRKSPESRLSADERESLKEAVVKLSELIVQSKDQTFKVPPAHAGFVAACLRQTDNITPRKIRFSGLYSEAF
jgi:hypothetical protein